MTPFLGGVYTVAFNFAPSGFTMCNGQTLAISTNTALFALIGTYYGGNGTTTFALPNLQGRVPIHQGTGLSTYVIGQVGGVENVTLLTTQLPAHNHPLNVNNAAPGTAAPAGGFFAAGPNTGSGPNSSQIPLYTATAPNAVLGNQTIGNTGGGQPFNVVNPYVAMTYVIALTGVFPSRN